MESRLSIVTLGVVDLVRATAFYAELGFSRANASNDNITFMQAGGAVLALYGRHALAEDAGIDMSQPGVDAPNGFAGITLAHNVRSEAEVDAVLAQAVAAGAHLIKPAQRVFWGGYSGYFADPEGHLWEVAHNPYCTFDAQGRIQLD